MRPLLSTQLLVHVLSLQLCSYWYHEDQGNNCIADAFSTNTIVPKYKPSSATYTNEYSAFVRSSPSIALSATVSDNNTSSAPSTSTFTSTTSSICAGATTPTTITTCIPSNREGELASKNSIFSTIDSLIAAQNNAKCATTAPSVTSTAATSAMGIFEGAANFITKTKEKNRIKTLKPGTVLIPQRTKLTKTSLIFRHRLKDHMSVRVALPSSDAEIANLRLSVFSDYSMDQRKEWIDRSCEVIHQRRLKGAMCLSASVNYIDEKTCGIHRWIIGSAECSTHEFIGTELGRRRPDGTIMYITEVAVSPRTRRSGIGALLLKGMDELAAKKNIETLYLHVDVENIAACNLYEKAGYTILDSNNELYSQFTTKLNLHDGATKGRKHHLMQKKVTESQTWNLISKQKVKSAMQSPRGTTTLGFDV